MKVSILVATSCLLFATITHIMICETSMALDSCFTKATPCMTKTDCGPNECCFNHHGPMIVSRRQLQKSGTDLQEGVCEKYKSLGDHCSPFDRLNGHCSCEDGLTCGFVPASTTPTMKRKLYFPGPGAYLCKKKYK